MRVKDLDIIGDGIIYKSYTIKIGFEMKGSCVQKIFKILDSKGKEIKDRLEGLSQAFYFIDNFILEEK